jgi:FKBP-type peptidyl-prolyl cis-trans isomerase 2
LPNDGDFVQIEYTGRTADGKVFDTTDEESGKKAGLPGEDRQYGPQLIIIGKAQVIPGIEQAVRGMKEGEEKELTLPPEKAFGLRNKDLIRIMPLSEFRKQRVNPVPGLVLSMDDHMATVRSVESGRVLVDFNHPLAGEQVSYRLKFARLLKTADEKANALLAANKMAGSVKSSASGLDVTFENASNTPEYILRRKAFLDSVVAFIPDIKEIRVSERIAGAGQEAKK